MLEGEVDYLQYLWTFLVVFSHQNWVTISIPCFFCESKLTRTADVSETILHRSFETLNLVLFGGVCPFKHIPYQHKIASEYHHRELPSNCKL